MPPLVSIIAEEGPPGWGAAAARAAAVGESVEVLTVRPGEEPRAAGRYVLRVGSNERVSPPFLSAAAERVARTDAPDVLAGASRWIDGSGTVVFEARPPEPFTLGQVLRLRTRWFDGRCVLGAGTAVRAGAVRGGAGVFETVARLAAAGARLEGVEMLSAEALAGGGGAPDANLRTVRAMLPVCRWALHEGADRLGEDARVARAEVEQVEERARAAEVVLSRWRQEPSAADDPAAVGEYADLEARRGGLSGVAAMALPHAILAAGAARALLPRRARVLWLCRDSGAVAAAVIKGLGARLVDATVAVHGEVMREHARCGLERLGSWRRRVRVVPAGGPGGPFDLVGCNHMLASAAEPETLLRALGAMVAPRGVLVLASEPREPGVMRPYVEALTRRLCDQVTLRTPMRLDPEADAFVERVIAEEAGSPGLWRRAHPSARGVDSPAILSRMGGFDEAMRREYGSLWWHPLTPFPYVEGSGVAQEDAWVTGVWRRR